MAGASPRHSSPAHPRVRPVRSSPPAKAWQGWRGYLTRGLAAAIIVTLVALFAVEMTGRTQATVTLRDAVTERSPGAVSRALGDGADPNTRYGASISVPGIGGFLSGWLPVRRAGSLAERQKRTALMEAVVFGDAASATLLLDAGADPDARDSEGRTALHYAALSRCRDGVIALRKHQASPNITDTAGETPLAYAQNHGATDPEIARLLTAPVSDLTAAPAPVVPRVRH